MQKCNHISHPPKRATRTHIPHTFQNGISHAHVRLHIPRVRARMHLCNSYLDLFQEHPEDLQYSLSEIPSYMHMTKHIYRSANHTKPRQYVKCFHDPEKVLILHNHFPMGCLGGVCGSYPVDPSVAHLQHYRSDCVNALKKSCEKDFKNESVVDTTIWKHKERLVKASREVLDTLGFLKSTVNGLKRI